MLRLVTGGIGKGLDGLPHTRASSTRAGIARRYLLIWRGEGRKLSISTVGHSVRSEHDIPYSLQWMHISSSSPSITSPLEHMMVYIHFPQPHSPLITSLKASSATPAMSKTFASYPLPPSIVIPKGNLTPSPSTYVPAGTLTPHRSTTFA